MKLFLALLAVIGVAQSSMKADAGIDAGKKIFRARCVACHNTDGKGKESLVRLYKIDAANLDLTSGDSRNKSDADLIKLILSGKDRMPAFKGKLKNSDIVDVLAYIRFLSAKAKTTPAKP